MANPVASAEQVRVLAALPPFTTEVGAALTAYLDGLLASLELAVNRPLTVQQFTETAIADAQGRIALLRTPVVAIVSVTLWGQPYDTLGYDPRYLLWTPGAQVGVTYTAGIDGANHAGLRHALLMKALPYAQALYAQAAVADAGTTSGETSSSVAVPGPVAGVKNFSVEGLTVGYESGAERTDAAAKAAKALGEAATWDDAEIMELGLSRLRKRVVA